MICGQDQVRLDRLIIVQPLTDLLLIMVLMMRLLHSTDLSVHAVAISWRGLGPDPLFPNPSLKLTGLLKLSVLRRWRPEVLRRLRPA